MEECIGFAADTQIDELSRILQEHDLGLAGEADEHVVLVKAGQVQGAGLLWQLDEDLFHLLTLGVAPAGRGQGVGGRLLRALCADPWSYCRDAAERTAGPYKITTVARGEAVTFYTKCGFSACEPDQLPDMFAGQCDLCPKREECAPVTMIYRSRAKDPERNSAL